MSGSRIKYPTNIHGKDGQYKAFPAKSFNLTDILIHFQCGDYSNTVVAQLNHTAVGCLHVSLAHTL